MNQPAYQISGGQDPPDPAAAPTPLEPELAPDPSAFAPEPPAEEPSDDTRGAQRSVGALSAKVAMLAERIKAQEIAGARLQSAVERIESTLSELTKRTQPMLETLSAELARQGATLESLRTDSESALDLHAQRVQEFEHRLGGVLREMRELVAAKVESYDIQLTDRLEQARDAVADQLAGFQEQVEELVRRFAAEAIPAEMRTKVEDLSSRFVHAETALAATRSSVEFLRSEVGSLTMVVRRLAPGASGT